MKKTIIALMALLGFSAQAAIIPGFSDVTDNGGGLFTYTFDTLAGDIRNADGLSFQGNGSPVLNATNGNPVSGQVVVQDTPNHGGLGIDGPGGNNSGPGQDNFTDDEKLRFALAGGTLFDLVRVTLNGGGNGHNDCTPMVADAPNMAVTLNSSKASPVVSIFSAWLDGCAGNPGERLDLASDHSNFQGISWFSIESYINAPADNTLEFSGYVESITLRVAGRIPEPAIIALFAAGLFGLGFARRRMRG